MNSNQPNSFMNLLTGYESQQSGSNVPNYSPNWQYPHPPAMIPQNPTPLSIPPQPDNNPKNNEGGDNASKWTLEEGRRLLKSWINVSTNLLIERIK